MKAECTVKFRCDLDDFAGMNRTGESGTAEKASAEEQLALTVEPDFQIVSVSWDE